MIQTYKSGIEDMHSIFTHIPKHTNCDVRKRIKVTRAPCRKRTGDAVLCAEKFGDLITPDHKVLSEGCESRPQGQSGHSSVNEESSKI